MPVNLLLCEGGDNSPDARVLTKLLAGYCAVQPSGGKYGMGERIKARREAVGQNTVYGLLDGDFSADFPLPTDQPKAWIGSDGAHFGWRWQRKEIENYLIDPRIVHRALGANALQVADYLEALQKARDAIAVYQAARIALTVRRPRFSPLANCFGPERGRLCHPFPDVLDEGGCINGILQVVRVHQANLLVSEAEVLTEFKLRLPECQPGGERFQAYLCAFSGKDLVQAMDLKLRALGFASAAVFLEKILLTIDQTADDLGDWLPEYRTLQNLMKM